jgi:Zn-dependent protease with chaperone function
VVTDLPSGTASACPQCGAALTAIPRYVTWCDRCEWNLAGANPHPHGSENLVDRWLARLVAAAARRRHDRLAAHPEDFPRLPSSALTVVASAAVLLAYAVFLLALVWFTVSGRGFWHWPLVVLGWLLVGATLPRPWQFGDEIIEIDRREQPALVAIVHALSEAVRAEPPSRIGVDTSLTYTVRPVGWSGRHALVIGLPIWTAQSWPVREAVIAHELAHLRHGDTGTGRLVGSALHVLSRTLKTVWPEYSEGAQDNINRAGIEMGPGARSNYLYRVLATFLMRVVASPMMGAHLLLLWLDSARSQHQEYLADRAAAAAVGPEHLIEGLAGVLALPGTVTRTAAAVRRGDSPWEALAETATLPAREVDRLRRLGARESHQLDARHPPTHLRIDLLERAPRPLSPYVADIGARQAAGREIIALQERLRRQVEDDLHGA